MKATHAVDDWDHFLFRVHANFNTRQAPFPFPVVSDGFVNDLYGGSLVFRDNIVKNSEVSVVIYYAPWCTASFEALQHIEKVSSVFHQQVFQREFKKFFN